MMARLGLRNSGTETEAQDIFQDALIVFWQKARKPDFLLTARLSTFLYGVCRNLWHKELDRKSRLTYEVSDGPDGSHGQYERAEQVQIVRRSIDALGATCRQVLMYHYFDGLSMQDIAAQLGFANADTAKSKKYKCKKELDRLIRSQYSASDFTD